MKNFFKLLGLAFILNLVLSNCHDDENFGSKIKIEDSNNGGGTDDGTGDGTDDGTGDGTDDGTGDGTDDGTGDGTDDGTGDGTNDGTGDGTENPNTKFEGQWVGVMNCALTNKSVVLTIETVNDNLVGVVDFLGIKDENPSNLGSFKFTAEIINENNLETTSTSWITEAEGTNMFNIEGVLSDDLGSITADIFGNECSTLTLTKRVNPIDATVLNGNWTGSYDCTGQNTNQGLTLELSGSGRKVEAIYTFYPLDNTNVGVGIYKMEGLYDGVNLDLEFTEWIQPTGNYVEIEFESIIDLTNGVLQGTFDESQCVGDVVLTKE